MPVGTRFVDRLNSRFVNVLTALGLGVPIGGYFWIIYHYGVNVIVADQMSDVTVVQDSYSHHFAWTVLWTQHNNDRLFFPDLLVILQAHTDHLNIRVEEFLSAIMLAAATMLLIWAHKRRSPSIPWLYYCPVALLTFSLVQYQSTIWGFQMCWYLVVLSLAAALVLLDRTTLSWITLAGAIGAAVVGTFSSSEGLMIWPVGLLLLYLRRRRGALDPGLGGRRLCRGGPYSYNFSTQAQSYALIHPWASIKFFCLPSVTSWVCRSTHSRGISECRCSVWSSSSLRWHQLLPSSLAVRIRAEVPSVPHSYVSDCSSTG